MVEGGRCVKHTLAKVGLIWLQCRVAIWEHKRGLF